MTYVNFIEKYLQKMNIGIPIYIKSISKEASLFYGIPEGKASAAISVAFKRIIDGNKVPNLRMYQKGIYYKTKVTPFGETGIDVGKLIEKKYIFPDIGYETGLSALYRIGLTSQIPNEISISTNVAKEFSRIDERLGVVLKQPKTTINGKNKYYLQILDILDCIDKAPVDAIEPYKIIANHINDRKLQYSELLAYADRYYNKKTIIELAHTASIGGASVWNCI